MLGLIRKYPGVISVDLCEEIMAKFDAYPRRSPSLIGSMGAVSRENEHLRQSTDLHITSLATHDKSWRPYDQALTGAHPAAIRKYAEDVPSTRYLSGTMGATGIQIRCYPKDSGRYLEHIDADTLSASYRVLSGVVYLNTVEKGVETHFPYQERMVKPVQG